MPLRVVLAEDNYLVREGLAALLDDVDDVEVVGTASDSERLLHLVDRVLPDAVLTDIRMPPTFTTEGIDAARTIRARHPTIGVVVLSQFVEEDWCRTLMSDGAAGMGYLLKDRVSDTEELISALRTVVVGGSSLDPRVVDALLSRRMSEADSPMPALSARELSVLQLMASGRSNAAIAGQLYLSERAVEKAISTTFVKLGLSEESETNRRVAAVLAFLDAYPAARRGGPAHLVP
jgi:DNA-binding NarL/FixJ family response regulator